MRHQRLVRLAVPLTVATLALAACGSQQEESPSGTGSSAAPTKTAKIAIIAPLSGDLAAVGVGMQNATQLAIDQANAANKIPGWKIEFQPNDDQAKADEGARVATRVSSDAGILGVVGTLNSSVAQSVQPVLARANIVMISPANTNPTLTQGAEAATKKRPYPNYFRTATTDSLQGPFAAQYVFNDAKLTKVALINDKKAYGQGITEAFKGEFTKLGGQIVDESTVNPGDKDFSAVISKVKAAGPQLVYYGGEYPEASLLTSQMKQQGLAVPLMGGDGLYDKTYIEVGKAASEGDLATSVGAPTESLESAKTFITDYNAKYPPGSYGPYGALAYDAANAIIEGMAKVLPNASAVDDKTRTDVVKAVQDVKFEGVTGEVGFDQYGDAISRILTVYQVKSAVWAAVKTENFQ